MKKNYNEDPKNSKNESKNISQNIRYLNEDQNILNSDKKDTPNSKLETITERLKIPHLDVTRSVSSQNSSTQITPRILQNDFILPYEVEKSIGSTVKEETKSALDIKLRKQILPKIDANPVKTTTKEERKENEDKSEFDLDEIDLN